VFNDESHIGDGEAAFAKMYRGVCLAEHDRDNLKHPTPKVIDATQGYARPHAGRVAMRAPIAPYLFLKADAAERHRHVVFNG
jgi:hypothetical protein